MSRFQSSSLVPCEAALIAGSGQLPHLILQGMKAAGIRTLVLDVQQDSESHLKCCSSAYYRLHPFEITKAAKLMKAHGVKEVTLAGGVSHSLVMQVRPWHLSWDVLRLWLSLPDTRADTILGAIANYFSQKGLPVVNSLKYLGANIISKSKSWFKTSKVEDSDALLGIVVAKTLGAVDVGQSVIVRKGSVIAVEGMEGTDRCLDRAIELGSEGAVLIKMAKPKQDLRFDVPTIGEGTFQRLVKGKFKALVIESDTTICTDLQGLERLSQASIEVVLADQEMIQKAFNIYRPSFDAWFQLPPK